MKKYFKKKWFIGIGVLVLVILAVGITVPVLAASGNNNANSYGNSYIDGPTMNRLAGVLGMTPSDLSSQLQSGKTLAALAQEHNVTTDALENAMVAPYADQLNTQVKYGYMTQDQADTLLANAKSKAGSLMQQDLSGTAGNNGQTGNGNGYYGGCYNYMFGNGGGYGPGAGWRGYMGPGMMFGWGSNYNNSGTTPTPNSNSNSSGNNSSFGGFGGFGRGMMGSW